MALARLRLAAAAATAAMGEASGVERALPAGAAALCGGPPAPAPPASLGARWLATAAAAPRPSSEPPLTLASLGIPEHEVEEGA